MALFPVNIGERVLEISQYVSPSAGLLPYRMVVIDSTVTPANYGTTNYGPVKYPTTAFVNGEAGCGVITGPASQDYTTGNEFTQTARVIAQNVPVNVRSLGIVPVISDTTTTATPINIGGYVASSTTTGQAGAVQDQLEGQVKGSGEKA